MATCRYPTDADDLWNALTNREHLPRWFIPISGDLRLGERYQLQGKGPEFVRQSSAEWGRAAIAAGDEPEAARAAAERTRAFYTGEAVPPEEA